ncbi:DEAD/DEAH box helicase [Roseospira goensis]|uniref:DEAD-box ATP-dependent RNA helicase RhpA n=1 Tax=Roseospira goensis TaxID=391922 RepID=A0A7W6S011_9PROT|nr:DEAD/DEAH box helicase [Roseospira goensis]MBB4286386.1 superfamily II DNA/RNA helicase [Roseospira goensis]
MKFADLGLSPETLKAIEEVGYETPTPIQEKAIPHVLMGRDVLGIAQTGTGKTAGFTLPMIEILANGRAKARMPRSLILAPTRELATQVAENFTMYGKYHKLDMALLIGGESMGDQMRALDKGVDVLIATPGRLLDLFERGKVLLRDVKVLVIDEADRMLDMGFIPDVERIVGLLPPLRQTLFFSATMDKAIRKLADAFLSNPREISIERRATAAETVSQHLAMVPRIDKREALRHILRSEGVRNAFIFCNRKRDVDVLNRSLRKHGFNTVALHGDMDQPTRNEMLRRFKDNEADLLVCSDVAARGLDIDNVSHVINFDIPTHSEDYVHRIGRTGRAGREGQAFSLATPDDAKYVAGIESLLGRTIPRLTLEGLDSVEGEGGETGEAAGAERGTARDRTARKRRGGRTRGDRPDVAAEAAPERSTPERSTPERPTNGRGGDERPARPTRGKRGGRRRDDDRTGVQAMAHADDVLAFGDHMPAFFANDSLVPMGAPMPASADVGDDDEAEDEADNAERASPATKRGKARTKDRTTKDRTTKDRSKDRAKERAAPTARRGERKRHGRRGEAAAEAPGDSAGEAVAPAPEAPISEAPAPEAPVSEAPVSEAPVSEGAGDAAADAPRDSGAASPEAAASEEQAAPPRKRRATRRRKPAATDETGSAETAPEPAPEVASGTESGAASESASEAAAPTADAGSEATPAEAAVTAETPAKPKRTRRTTKKTAKAPKTAEAAGEETGAEATDATETDAAAEPKPKPKRTRRTTKKAASAAEAVEAEAEAGTAAPGADGDGAEPAAPAKPKRTRRKTAKAADEAGDPEAASEAPKPKARRTRSRKTTTKEADSSDSESGGAAEAGEPAGSGSAEGAGRADDGGADDGGPVDAAAHPADHAADV